MADKQAAPIAGQTAQSGPQAVSDAPAPATAGVPGAVLDDTAPTANGAKPQVNKLGLDEIVSGGKFIVNGVTVDAEGRPIKK